MLFSYWCNNAIAGFSSITDYIESEHITDQTRTIRKPTLITRHITEWYGQSADPDLANEKLSTLLDIALGNIRKNTPTDPNLEYLYNKERSLLLSQVAKAYAQQSNEEIASSLLEEAIKNVQNEDRGGFVVFEVAASIAPAYGEFSDAQTAVAGLTELTALVQRIPKLDTEKFEALAAIAIAYSQIDEQEKAQAVAATIARQIPAQESLNRLLPSWQQLASLYEKIGDSTAQQAIYLQTFLTVDSLQIENYLHNKTLDSLLDSYTRIDDDAIAQKVFEPLKSLIQQSDEHYNGRPNALAKLALAAQGREQYDIAQALLTEATEFIASDSDTDSSQQFYALYIIAESYGNMPNNSTKQAGFATIRSLSAIAIKPELRSLIDNMIIRTDAGLGPWL